ncbi:MULTISPECIES: hypothetical protein [unclassified Brevibacterium]|nr:MULTISPECIES: hypothetical protein [unclassified Brevibacterium]
MATHWNLRKVHGEIGSEIAIKLAQNHIAPAPNYKLRASRD